MWWVDNKKLVTKEGVEGAEGPRSRRWPGSGPGGSRWRADQREGGGRKREGPRPDSPSTVAAGDRLWVLGHAALCY